MSKDKGFTLIEIILVMVLLGIVAGLSFPNLSQRFYQIQLHQQSDQLAAMMRYAQSRAIIDGKNCRIAFSPDQSGYWLEQERASSEEDVVSYQRLSGRLSKGNVFTKEVSVEKETEEVMFNPDGQMDRIEITLCYQEKCRVVSTKEISGYIYVFDKEE